MSQSQPGGETIDVLLTEGRSFPPPKEFCRQVNVNDPAVYERARRDPEGFWAGRTPSPATGNGP